VRPLGFEPRIAYAPGMYPEPSAQEISQDTGFSRYARRRPHRFSTARIPRQNYKHIGRNDSKRLIRKHNKTSNIHAKTIKQRKRLDESRSSKTPYRKTRSIQPDKTETNKQL
jgi:hypothetical protein